MTTLEKYEAKVREHREQKRRLEERRMQLLVEGLREQSIRIRTLDHSIRTSLEQIEKYEGKVARMKEQGE